MASDYTEVLVNCYCYCYCYIALQYRHERVKWQKVKDDKSTEGPIEKETRGPNTVNVLAIN